MEIVSDMVREDPKFLLDVAWLRRQLIDLPEAEKLSEVCAVFNPGGVLTPEGKVILILRFETRKGNSGLVCCGSEGEDSFRVIPESLHFSLVDEGLEDPRVVWFGELGLYIITYVVAKKDGSCIAFITTKDFKKFKRKGEANFADEPNAPIAGRSNKDACVLPVSIEANGEKHFGLIHRPEIAGRKDIWFSSSVKPIKKRNLIAWEGHRRIAETRRGTTFWDNFHIGLGPQPVELPDEICKNLPKGFPLFYHGVRGTIYRTGAMWFSEEKLAITHRSPEWLFGPENGCDSNIYFPCAAWYDAASGESGEIIMYYGVNDNHIRRCRWDVQKLISYLGRHPV